MTTGDISASARGVGGIGGTGSNGNGGDGGGGDGGSTSLDIEATLNAASYNGFSRGLGGAGGVGSTGTGLGGDASSGFSDIDIWLGGVATFTTNASISNSAFGGNGSSGGVAEGSDAEIIVSGTLTAGGLVNSSTQAFGGTASSGAGGAAYGGYSALDVTGGTLTAANLFMGAQATGGNGVTSGGDASGGAMSIYISGGSANFSNGALLRTDAIGGNASNGTGGTASGGYATVQTYDGGSLTGGFLNMISDGTGGNGAVAGSAYGGSAQILSDSTDSGLPTSISFSSLNLSANGMQGIGGGDGEVAPYGSGGSVSLYSSGGSVGADTLIATANGSTYGGDVTFQSLLGSDTQVGGLQFGSVSATANGGDYGGFVFLNANSGTTIDLGDAVLNASGAFGGTIDIFAGNCNCGAETGLIEPFALTTNSGVVASNLTLTSSGNIYVALTDGAGISVDQNLQANAGTAIGLSDDGTGGSIQADFDLPWSDQHRRQRRRERQHDFLVIGVRHDADGRSQRHRQHQSICRRPTLRGQCRRDQQRYLQRRRPRRFRRHGERAHDHRDVGRSQRRRRRQAWSSGSHQPADFECGQRRAADPDRRHDPVRRSRSGSIQSWQ